VLLIKKHLLLFAALIILLSESCTYLKKDDQPKPHVIAKAFERNLLDKDILNIIPKGTSHQDSITIIHGYINNWLKQQVVLQKAEDNLNAEQKNVQKQLDEYRNSLITYIYERQLVNQNLDTSVSDNEIEKYYNDNASNFELKDNIIKVLYLRVPANAPKLDKIRKWYKSDNEKDRIELEEYCYQFASDFNLSDEEWLLFDDLLKKVPIKTYDKEEYLRNNRFIETNDTSSIWFVNIKGFKIKESFSPLSFEKDNIRNLIVNKRKLELIETMEKTAFEQALKNNNIKIYNVKK